MARFPILSLLFTLLVLTSVPAGLLAQTDSLTLDTDSINISAEMDSLEYKSPIEDIITYPARDSTVYDLKSQTVYMYGAAKVTYGDITLTADYIEYDFSKMQVRAHGLTDSIGMPVGRPVFNQGGQSFDSDTMNYNFNTERGLIKSVRTNEGDSYVHAEVSKKQDSGQIHNYGGKYTTCNLENPHYHFRFNKMVVIPNEKIVTGPVYMKVRSVPVPLALPFGYFPNSNKQKAGILIPGYGQNQQLGFFLLNGGYYLPISDKMDTKLTADIYSRGSWGLRNVTRYFSRYNHSGDFDLTYNKRLQGDRALDNFSKRSSFFVRWNHRQDAKARPGISFSASVNAGTSNNFRNNFNSSQNDYISSTFTSSVNFSRRWDNSQLTLSARHNQNTETRNVTFTLPQIGYSLNRFYLPLSFLRGDNSTGAKRWYETIGVRYNTDFENRLSTSEPELRLGKLDLLRDKIINGIQHSASLNTSIKAGYISINPSISLNERWHFSKSEKSLVADDIVTDTVQGFFTTRNVNMSVNMTTKMYGMYAFRGDGIKAIRHVMTPSVGLRYMPEVDLQESVTDTAGTEIDYNPFTTSAYTQSGFTRKQASVTMGLQNNLEAKVKSRKDTTGTGMRKIKIIENFTINTAYNLAADSVRLDDLRLSGRTTLYKGTTVQYNGRFSLYDVNSSGGKIDRLLIDTNEPFARALSHTVTINTTLSGGSDSKKTKSSDKNEFASSQELEELGNEPSRYVDFNTPWNLSLAYTFGQFNNWKAGESGLDRTVSKNQNVLFTGDIRIMKRWKFGVSSGYDLVNKDWSSTQLSFYWDLHCWEFNINYIPQGDRKSYNAYIGVKAPILQDLKLQRRGLLGNGNGGLFQ